MELPFHTQSLGALLTGGVGLIPELTVTHFAIKEAALPGILGILTVLTLKTKNLSSGSFSTTRK